VGGRASGKSGAECRASGTPKSRGGASVRGTKKTRGRGGARATSTHKAKDKRDIEKGDESDGKEMEQHKQPTRKGKRSSREVDYRGDSSEKEEGEEESEDGSEDSSFALGGQRAWEVGKIMNKRTRRGHLEYAVRWAGCNSDEDSWEKKIDAPQAIADFERLNTVDGKKPAGKKKK
jgi:hypothetical protein